MGDRVESSCFAADRGEKKAEWVIRLFKNGVRGGRGRGKEPCSGTKKKGSKKGPISEKLSSGGAEFEQP